MSMEIVIEKLDRIESLLKSQTDQILTFEQAAKYADLSKSFLYKATSQGKIPHYKPRGKRVYFSKRELDEWLLQNPVKTKSEIERQAADYVTLGKKGGAE